MDIDDAAAQRQMGAIAAQDALIDISDNPGQFRQGPMMALINQAYRARSGQDDGMSYLTVPF
jgi:hypothetical protein